MKKHAFTQCLSFQWGVYKCYLLSSKDSFISNVLSSPLGWPFFTHMSNWCVMANCAFCFSLPFVVCDRFCWPWLKKAFWGITKWEDRRRGGNGGNLLVYAFRFHLRLKSSRGNNKSLYWNQKQPMVIFSSTKYWSTDYRHKIKSKTSLGNGWHRLTQIFKCKKIQRHPMLVFRGLWETKKQG